MENKADKRAYKCPVCEKRIFDARGGGKATITIKCPKCRSIVEVTVAHPQPAPSGAGCG